MCARNKLRPYGVSCLSAPRIQEEPFVGKVFQIERTSSRDHYGNRGTLRSIEVQVRQGEDRHAFGELHQSNPRCQWSVATLSTSTFLDISNLPGIMSPEAHHRTAQLLHTSLRNLVPGSSTAVAANSVRAVGAEWSRAHRKGLRSRAVEGRPVDSGTHTMSMQRFVTACEIPQDGSDATLVSGRPRQQSTLPIRHHPGASRDFRS